MNITNSGTQILLTDTPVAGKIKKQSSYTSTTVNKNLVTRIEPYMKNYVRIWKQSGLTEVVWATLKVSEIGSPSVSTDWELANVLNGYLNFYLEFDVGADEVDFSVEGYFDLNDKSYVQLNGKTQTTDILRTGNSWQVQNARNGDKLIIFQPRN